MSDTETLDLLIEGGKAKPGPATAPRLGALKVNIGRLFQDINQKTKDYSGMNVPVKVIVNKDHSYKIEIGTPPVSSLIRKELGLKKIAPEKKEEEGEAVGTKKKAEKGEETKEPEKKEEKKEDVKKKEEKKEDVKKEVKEVKEGTEEKTAEKKEDKPKVREIIANVKIDQCVKIARMKRASLLAKTFKGAVREIVGSCASMPVTVEGKSPKEVLKEIDQGKYDSIIKE